jgi:hexokinase
METLPSFELNTFLHNPLAGDGLISGLFAKDELDAVAAAQYLATLVNERAGMLAAALVAGTIVHMTEQAVEREKYPAGLDPSRPIRVAIEGSTYMMYGQMRRALESHLHRMVNFDKPRSYLVRPVSQASLIGAAVAALSE